MAVVDDRVEHELYVDAPPALVFAMFTEAERYVQWMGQRATLDPRPGGTYRVVVNDSATIAGTYTVVEPHSRVEFTWGFEGSSHSPPGSSVVSVTLIAHEGGTRLRLVHTGLEHPALAPHDRGWTGHLARLVVVA